MALMLSNTVLKICTKSLEEKFVGLMISGTYIQKRDRHVLNPKPRLRNPVWFTRKTRALNDDFVTAENKEFLKEVVQDTYPDDSSPLKNNIVTNLVEYRPGLLRTGVIAKKIGIYPMWLKNGKKIITTLLQVLDNHVIKYYTPEEYDPPRKKPQLIKNKRGCLLLGAGATDPTILTKEYCGLFKDSGVMPKMYLSRFFITPESILPPGTPINALHFKVGQFVDVRGKTIDRGFQGVMKRHGFKGMPASHGVTKTHRRGGNIGGGGEKGRVWPGTKMPGHMGNRLRILKGLKIWRINTKHNVLFVSGQAIPGETNSIVTVYDTILPLRKPKEPLHVPTYLSEDPVPEELYDSEVHVFSDPSIEYNE